MLRQNPRSPSCCSGPCSFLEALCGSVFGCWRQCLPEGFHSHGDCSCLPPHDWRAASHAENQQPRWKVDTYIESVVCGRSEALPCAGHLVVGPQPV